MASSVELPPFVHDSIATIALQEGFTSDRFSVIIESGCNKGDGFSSDLFRVIVEQDGRKLVLLCKLPPLNQARRQQFNSMKIFERESLLYSKLLPNLIEFQSQKGVQPHEGFFNVPKCYLASCDVEKEQSIIALEDLRERGLKMWNKMIPVNYEHARMLMVHLGRYHAVSFAIKDQQPELFEQFKIPDLMTTAMAENEAIRALVNATMDRAIGVLDADEDVARWKMVALKENYFEAMRKCCDGAGTEPYAVLVHGDCWINNMMFSYKNKIPESMILLDWQGARYASPVLDLSYFFSCCTDEAFRRQYYDEMLNIYYGSLRDLLERLGGDPARQFPFTALLRQLTRNARYGVMLAAFVLPVICTANEDIPDLNDAAERYHKSQQLEANMFANSGSSEEAFRRRMRGLIRDMVRFGYI
ncbi:uncharacterized oxidoreductase dhs-27-like [Toxorhynchites rutilus septentrionalis]|uniref:uncharacterized oxidoreductase dhs-27-like n=1 Tax=Toxorhynchites rutilus septentrionalis TaxID=329112 RepID=UPI0024799307|nr:uncharacterized oxidoreductase dhs-27-like [Toxorhynchites rutilus septentrionalis]